jgi:hypothetical protein
MILRADGHVPLLRMNHMSNNNTHGINEIFALLRYYVAQIGS